MTNKDLYTETITSIKANPARTGLTVLGIVIGIASVIVMLAIGNGAQSSISSSISALGSNILTVMGGGATRGGGVNLGRSNQQTLTLTDATALKEKVPLANYVSPELRSRAQVKTGSTNTNTQVNGVYASYEPVHALTFEEGSFFTDEQVRSGAKVAVLGPTTRDDLFGVGETAVGESIVINNVKFVIIGVTKSKGGSGFGSTDDEVFIPLTSAQRYISGTQFLSTISVTTENQSDLPDLQTQVTNVLLETHNIKDPTLANFTVLNQADLASTASSVTKIFTILLSSVASISLLVGGIGIMNMMLTNVRERTREIGLRKAIGAKKKDISNQFLAESVLITLLGGIIGVLIGIGVAKLITLTGLLQTQVTSGPIILAFSVSAGIGIVFGYYPAKKASELNPIDALRYE